MLLSSSPCCPPVKDAGQQDHHALAAPQRLLQLHKDHRDLSHQYGLSIDEIQIEIFISTGIVLCKLGSTAWKAQCNVLLYTWVSAFDWTSQRSLAELQINLIELQINLIALQINIGPLSSS